jgi:Rrf2 family protein
VLRAAIASDNLIYRRDDLSFGVGAMLYSVGCEYAIQALSRLAGRVKPGEYCLLRDILDGADLPGHFVGKIFQTLVREDILVSAKGRGGGFALCRPPDKITLRQVVEAIDGSGRHKKRCFLGFSECEDHPDCRNHRRCDRMRDQIDELLDETTLADLIQLTAETKGARSRKR